MNLVPAKQPFVLIDGGMVTNDSNIDVFDLSVLNDSDAIKELIDLHRRINECIDLHYGSPATAPPALSRAFDRIRERFAENLGVSVEMFGELLLNSDDPDRLLSERVDDASYGAPYGEHTADLLARTALALLDDRGQSARDLPQIVLTDLDAYTHTEGAYRAESEDRVRFALEQYELTTGDYIDPENVIDDLEYDVDHLDYDRD